MKLVVQRLNSRIAMVNVVGGAVRVLSAIARLGADSAANQMALAKAGGIGPLIVWLAGTLDGATGRNYNADAQCQAVFALLSLATNNATLQALIAKSNGIPPLIDLVAEGSTRTQVTSHRLPAVGARPPCWLGPPCRAAICDASRLPCRH